MASLEMQGPYPLTGTKIDEEVLRTSPGNYALGDMRDDTFTVRYVGRSDADVNTHLHEWVGVPDSAYKRFKFSYASSVKAAFEKECRNYHDFGGSDRLNNERHPARPDGTIWKCRVCSYD